MEVGHAGAMTRDNPWLPGKPEAVPALNSSDFVRLINHLMRSDRLRANRNPASPPMPISDRGRYQEADNRAQRCCLRRRGRNPLEATTKPSCRTTSEQSAGKTAHEKATMSERRTCGRADKGTESYGRHEEHEKPGVFHWL